MKKISTKLSLVIIACSFVAIFLLGGISIARGHIIVRGDAKETLGWMARQYASQFSNELNMIENNVQEMEVHFKDTFDFERLKVDPSYLAEYETELAQYIFNFASKRSQGIAAWCYFNPELSDTPHDVYYVDGNGDNIPDRQNYIPLSYYDETPTPTDDKQWWYGPIEKKGGFWTNPYEWTLNNDEVIKVVSYAMPIFYEDELIAVIGTYYHFDEMYESITAIEVYENGYAALLNEKLDVIIHPNYESGTRYTSDNLQTVEAGKFAEVSAQIMKGKHGIGAYEENGSEQLTAYAKLSNGWTLMLMPKSDEMFAKVYTLTYQLLASVIFCMLLSVAASYIAGVSIAKPLRRVVAGAKKIGGGDLSVYIDINTKDEIKSVADSLNEMVISTKALQGELEKLAYYDDLTGIANKNLFLLTAAELIAAGKAEYAYIVLDINKFKLVNDIFGYAYGDLLLKHIAKTVSEEFCVEEAAARYTGDIFHILCKFSSDSRTALEERLKKLAEKIADYQFAHHADYRITMCFGIYVIENVNSKIEAMGDRASFALKQIKDTYTTATYFFNDAIRNRIIEEQEIENEMEAALANGEFKVYLQPKYSLDTEQMGGAEALVRWLHPKKGLISPVTFIPVFEKNKFITKLDLYMLEQVCRRLRKWIDMGKAPVVISVNQSRLHLHNPNYLGELTRILARYDISAKWIELEITESAFFEDTEKMIEVMNSLHELNFKISMDDFGSGYSSLNMLQDIAVDVLKIDKNFFNESSNSERGKKIVDNIISMADDLNIVVVAEGVETAEQVAFLKQTNCHLVQGYYFARPMPIEDFEDKYYTE